jgi:hypothetical protein
MIFISSELDRWKWNWSILSREALCYIQVVRELYSYRARRALLKGAVQ